MRGKEELMEHVHEQPHPLLVSRLYPERMLSRLRLWPNNDSGNSASRNAEQRDKKTLIKRISMEGTEDIFSLAFLDDDNNILSGGREGKIRRWETSIGKETGTLMDAGGMVNDIVVSQDGRWIVSGTSGGQVTVWDATSYQKVREFKGHSKSVNVVDFSADTSKVISGSIDWTAAVWSRTTGKRLHELPHKTWVAAAKFSPDGQYIATATCSPWTAGPVRTFDGDGRLLVEFPFQVSSASKQCLAWGSDSNHLFALSNDCNIYSLDLATRTTIAKWAIDGNPGCCIARARNGRFIAVATDASLSFWDTATNERISPMIEQPDPIHSLAISADYDIATSVKNTITLWGIRRDILSSVYFDNISGPQACNASHQEASLARMEQVDLEESLEERSNEQSTNFQKIAQELRDQLAELQASYEAQSCEIETLRSSSNEKELEDLRASSRRDAENLSQRSDEEIRNLENTIQQLRMELAASRRKPNRLTQILHSSVDATTFKLPVFDVYRGICEVLEGDGRIAEAINCLRQMQVELAGDTGNSEERVRWELGFQRRCKDMLEKLGENAMNSQQYDEAVQHLSIVLSLDRIDRIDALVKRSEALVLIGAWEDALTDADEVIKLDPSSHRGHERRHAALHVARRHTEAVDAFHTMLSKLKESLEEHIRALHSEYLDITPVIRQAIEQSIRHAPRVLIDTTTGRLYDKSQQGAAFEKLPIFNELRSSMTTRVSFDHTRIRREVKRYYRYVMLSHRWEYGEPLFQMVQNISVYELEPSSPNTKLKTLCKVVHALGFQWVWSDTCCIDKRDNIVLQESLVAMFTWYRGSALTLVYIRGVWSQLQKPGDLQKSVWNTRAWTFQEYVAAETVQFYTEDWKPYLGLEIFNHKLSPVITKEMEQVSHISAREMAALCPGLDRVRQKLFLVSGRETSVMEDAAYSLLGIFNAAIPVIYGEGNRAIGRLLEHILTGSGDVTILAWTGPAGEYNTCLPPDLTVYSQLIPPQIPQSIEITEMKLYHRFNDLPSSSLASTRLRFSGLVFSITKLVESHLEIDSHTYRATTSSLGEVEIKTKDNLFGMEDLFLMHPWISTLLDQDFSRRRGATGLDDKTLALRLVAHLRQPFGALLLVQATRVQFKRVATDSLIMVQINKETSLTELMNSIVTVDVK
ncbi:hypothetical protein JVU11DRAFT_10144 [Chiua virens]|nr:hypothetical protein JVU11DRAFT_10144 [Chiua virens]